MSTIKLSSITNKAKTSGPVIVGVTSSTAEGYARLASGTNADRVGIESGSIRYNETAKLLEFYDGTQWNFIIPAEESANAIGVFGGGANPSYQTATDYITISTLGNALDFGDLTQARWGLAACSSTTRGVFGGGSNPNNVTRLNTIDYITIATAGNASDFGDLTTSPGSEEVGACSSSTRGIFAGGQTPTGNTNRIDYVTIATTGNATIFGDLTIAREGLTGVSNSTRGVFSGDWDGTTTNIIDYITIATTGNAITFGSLIEPRAMPGGCSSSTRGVYGAGYNYVPAIFYTDAIEYITIATTGNINDFGDLSARKGSLSACSSSTRGVFSGGYVNIMEYITIATFGNSIYFGDNTFTGSYRAACSNNHGGLL